MKKHGLAIDTQLVAPVPSGITVSDTGSLRGDGITVNMQGLNIDGAASASQPTSSPISKTGSAWLTSTDVEHMLGEGSSGVVKLVRHRATRQRYALKVIPLGCSEQERKQILMELRTLHMSHVSAIVAFHDAFYAEGAVHVVLEYMDCGSLADVLHRQGPLPERLLSKITQSVLAGLAHLHGDLKTVHRDIKPSNLLLNSCGEAKIGDFGMSGQLASSFSRLASWVGTAAYMSPERISSSDYSYEADIWSLGVSLWECAVGRYPHGTAADASGTAVSTELSAGSGGGGTTNRNLLPEERTLGLSFWDLLHCIVEGEPPPLPANLAFSAPFCELVQACLAKDCAKRPCAVRLLEHSWLSEQQPHLVDLSMWLQTTHPDGPEDHDQTQYHAG